MWTYRLMSSWLCWCLPAFSLIVPSGLSPPDSRWLQVLSNFQSLNVWATPHCCRCRSRYVLLSDLLDRLSRLWCVFLLFASCSLFTLLQVPLVFNAPHLFDLLSWYVLFYMSATTITIKSNPSQTEYECSCDGSMRCDRLLCMKFPGVDLLLR